MKTVNIVMKTPFELFVHVAVMDTWKTSMDIIQIHIKNSGILDSCEKVNYCINGNMEEANLHFTSICEKEQLIYLSPDVNCFEFPTLNYLLIKSNQTDMNVMYIHTKGASSPEISKRRGASSNYLDHMSYNCISKYIECQQALNAGFDCSGYAFSQYPFVHYSGNAWWAKSQYIRQLKPLNCKERNFHFNEDFPFRHDAEKWLCSAPGKFHNMLYSYTQSKYFGLTY